MEIIIKRYEHHNRSFGNWDSPKGKYISSRKHYEQECIKQGMIPFEQARELGKKEKDRIENSKYGGLSKEAMSLIHSVNPDKRGNIQLSDRQIDKLRGLGVKIEKESKWVTEYDKKHGGFDNGK